VIFRIPKDRINWTTSSFLIGTFFLTLTAVPLYLWYFGVDWFHFGVFAVLLAATGFSITLGYHRLFSHMTFRAKLPVREQLRYNGANGVSDPPSPTLRRGRHRR
jgi:stearoyl-CoA desaturase (delta-9 desaturase)